MLLNKKLILLALLLSLAFSPCITTINAQQKKQERVSREDNKRLRAERKKSKHYTLLQLKYFYEESYLLKNHLLALLFFCLQHSF